ncbi:MAG TPA: DUF5671 domain-containing protein [Ktedonobacterales bacterium]
MARGLYRVYLYVVTIALCIFATVGIALALGAILATTPLRGTYYGANGASEVTQQIIFAVVAVLIAALIGGLHYWLIRRDMASDPQPGASGVRSLLLNLAVGGATLFAVGMGASALQSYSFNNQNDVATPLAASIATLGLALLLEWERRRATPSHGAALIFQRLRIDGVGLILGIMLASFVIPAGMQSETAIAQATSGQACTNFVGGPYTPYSGPEIAQCAGPFILGHWLAVALILIVWLAYLRPGAFDQKSTIRAVILLIGFAVGVGVALNGLVQAFGYILRLLFRSAGTSAPDYLNAFNFAPFLVYGAIAIGVYLWLLRQPREQEALGPDATRLSLRAVAGALFAVPFWVGAFMLVENVLLSILPNPTLKATYWYDASAASIAGIPYILLALWLAAGTRETGVKGPRRAFDLALLAAGALATAGGLATLIYAVLTSALGVPLPNWQDVARVAGSILIAGLALGGLYLWISLREGQFVGTPKPQAAPATTGEPQPANALLSGVLAKLAGGSISQDEASREILDLARRGSLT